MQGKLKIHRNKSILGLALKYNIFLDGKEISKIGNNKTIEKEINFGKHELYITVDDNAFSINNHSFTAYRKWKSDVIYFNLNEDTPTLNLQCFPSLNGKAGIIMSSSTILGAVFGNLIFNNLLKFSNNFGLNILIGAAAGLIFSSLWFVKKSNKINNTKNQIEIKIIN